jgi:hypothetical protein
LANRPRFVVTFIKPLDILLFPQKPLAVYGIYTLLYVNWRFSQIAVDVSSGVTDAAAADDDELIP